MRRMSLVASPPLKRLPRQAGNEGRWCVQDLKVRAGLHSRWAPYAGTQSLATNCIVWCRGLRSSAASCVRPHQVQLHHAARAMFVGLNTRPVCGSAASYPECYGMSITQISGAHRRAARLLGAGLSRRGQAQTRWFRDSRLFALRLSPIRTADCRRHRCLISTPRFGFVTRRVRAEMFRPSAFVRCHLQQRLHAPDAVSVEGAGESA